MRMIRNIVFPCIIALVFALPLGFISSADAQEETAAERGPNHGFGVRTGLGLDPDQWVVGAQAILGKSLGIFRLAPSFDVGFGSDLSTYALNLDLTLNGTLPGSRSQLYAGAGPAIVHWDPSDGGASDLEVGLNLLGGFRLATKGTTQYSLEARFGLSDAPDFRLLIGVLFGSGEPAP
jgi:hypothetical protein